MQVDEAFTADDLSAFVEEYANHELAAIYWGLPEEQDARDILGDDRIIHHVILNGRVASAYVNGIDAEKRVIITDPFNRQARNADYPAREFFTDRNTIAGNPDRLDFGDFSIVGNHYMEQGGPAFAVALHHIHFRNNPGPLDISHLISDRTETSVDTPGKIIEALDKLVAALPDLEPNDTEACDEYRQMAEDEVSRGLGYMKRLAIKHHLEVMLGDGIQL